MRLPLMGALFALTLSLGTAAPQAIASGATCRTDCNPEEYTCHECCRIRCIGLYPGNPGMQNLCTWSCIDQNCGGGPFP